MITVKQQSKFMDRIKTMSELELASLLDDLKEHLGKNHMWHLLEDADQTRALERAGDELDELENVKDNLVDKLTDIEAICDNAMDVEEFEEDAFESVQKSLQQIKDIC